MLSGTDLGHLRACVDLARAAIEAGEEPFGSVLVDGAGEVRFSGHNAERSRGDATAHPELDIALWAAREMTVDERAAATVYTSGEHCPMCAAAHAWVGLGRIVYAVSSARLAGWLREWGVPAGPVASLPISRVAPGLEVDGPAAALEPEMRNLHFRRFAGEWPSSGGGGGGGG